MRNKIYRLRKERKYKDKAKKIAKEMLTESEFHNGKLHGSYDWADSYEEAIEIWTHQHESNRKICGCLNCRNQRKNKFLPKHERRTFVENKFHEKADEEIQEYFNDVA